MAGMKTDPNSDGVTESYLARIDRLMQKGWQDDMEIPPITLADLAERTVPNSRAELAELRAQVRYLADDLRGLLKSLDDLVGPWPHELQPNS